MPSIADLNLLSIARGALRRLYRPIVGALAGGAAPAETKAPNHKETPGCSLSGRPSRCAPERFHTPEDWSDSHLKQTRFRVLGAGRDRRDSPEGHVGIG